MTHNCGRMTITWEVDMARRILVVEDETPIREMVSFVLEQNGYQPLEAESYDGALSRLCEPDRKSVV